MLWGFFFCCIKNKKREKNKIRKDWRNYEKTLLLSLSIVLVNISLQGNWSCSSKIISFVYLSLSLSVAFHLFHLSTSWSGLSYSSARNAFQRKINYNALSFILSLPPSTLLHLPLSVSRTTWARLKRCAAHFCAYDDYNWDWTLAVSQMTSSFYK